MFRRHPTSIADLLPQYLRREGLETPLLEHRLMESWEAVTSRIVARYTVEKRLSNQILYVKISNPALRQDLSMMRTELVKKLNAAIGTMLITDVRIY